MAVRHGSPSWQAMLLETLIYGMQFSVHGVVQVRQPVGGTP